MIKVSQKYWLNHYNGKYDKDIHLEESFDKEAYDKILSLEAKIEVLKTSSLDRLIKHNGIIMYVREAITSLESELSKLQKEHNLL